MIIHRLTAFFGRHSQDSLRLEPGLNVLQCPADVFSPWQSYFLDLFFGGRAESYPGVIPLAGQLRCQYGEMELALIRKTDEVVRPLEDFIAILPETGEEVAGLTAGNCGRVLLGVQREALEQSVMIGPKAAGVESMETPARPKTDAAALRGQIGELQQRIVELEAQEVDCASQLMTDLSPQDAAERLDALRVKREAAEYAERQAASMAGQLAAAMVPGNAAISRLRKAIVNLFSLQKQLGRAQGQQNQAAAKLQQVEAEIRNSPFAGKSAEEARKMAETPLNPVNHRVPPTSVAVVLLGIILSAVAFWQVMVQAKNTPLAIASVVVLMGLSGIVARIFWLRDLQRRRQALLRRRYGTDDPGEIAGLAESYGKALTAKTAAQRQLQNAAAEVETLTLTYSDTEQAILTEIRRFAPDTMDIATADDMLRKSAVARKDLAKAEQDARLARDQYEELLAPLKGPDPAGEEADDARDKEKETLALRLEDVRSTLANTRRELEQLSEELAGTLGFADMERRAAEDVLCTLLPNYETLPDALVQRTLEIFRQMPNNGTGLYLAARLAVSELSVPVDREVPLFLEDVLETFSDEECGMALAWLKEAAERRQIVMFTHSNREVEMLKGDAGVHCQGIIPSPNWYRTEED